MFDTSGADNAGFPTGTSIPSYYPADQLAGGYGSDQLSLLHGEQSYYTDPTDQAALQREISRAQTSINKPSSSTDVGQSSSSVGNGERNWTSWDGILNNLGDISNSTNSNGGMSAGKYMTSTPDEKASYTGSVLDKIKGFLPSILAVIVGFVLLLGAFMIYKDK